MGMLIHLKRQKRRKEGETENRDLKTQTSHSKIKGKAEDEMMREERIKKFTYINVRIHMATRVFRRRYRFSFYARFVPGPLGTGR